MPRYMGRSAQAAVRAMKRMYVEVPVSYESKLMEDYPELDDWQETLSFDEEGEDDE